MYNARSAVAVVALATGCVTDSVFYAVGEPPPFATSGSRTECYLERRDQIDDSAPGSSAASPRIRERAALAVEDTLASAAIDSVEFTTFDCEP